MDRKQWLPVLPTFLWAEGFCGTAHILVGRVMKSRLQTAPANLMEGIVAEKEGEERLKRVKIQVLIFFVLFLLLNNCPLKKFTANRYSKKYHNYNCIYGMKIRQDNRIYVRTTRGVKELEKKGFMGCRLCKPLQDSKANGNGKSGKTSSDEGR